MNVNQINKSHDRFNRWLICILNKYNVSNNKLLLRHKRTNLKSGIVSYSEYSNMLEIPSGKAKFPEAPLSIVARLEVGYEVLVKDVKNVVIYEEYFSMGVFINTTLV
jgi:hypothetical protein